MSSPNCKCGTQAKKIQSKKDNENRGRYFYCCPSNQCKFFTWVGTPTPSGIKCKCNKDLQKRQCKKENENQGRYFYSCFSCNHFVWAKESATDEEKRKHEIYQNVVDLACAEPVNVYTQSAEEVAKILRECEDARTFYPDTTKRPCIEKPYTATDYRKETYPAFVYRKGFKILL